MSAEDQSCFSKNKRSVERGKADVTRRARLALRPDRYRRRWGIKASLVSEAVFLFSFLLGKCHDDFLLRKSIFPGRLAGKSLFSSSKSMRGDEVRRAQSRIRMSLGNALISVAQFSGILSVLRWLSSFTELCTSIYPPSPLFLTIYNTVFCFLTHLHFR